MNFPNQIPSRILASFFLLAALLPARLDAYQPRAQEQEFLNRLETDTLQFFIAFANPETGLVKDSSRPGSPASIASTGFGLIAWALAKENGWISYKEAYEKIITCLKFLRGHVDHERGFFYHMISVRSGKRVWSSEASSIDTALLIAGALYAGNVFKGTEAELIAKELYERVDWDWMRNGSQLLCHGWKPESGFLPYYWDMYSEHLLLQALAIGSPTHPAPKEIWNAWERLEGTYNGKAVVYAFSGSLFTYQFSQAYIDFRELWDKDVNYFENSRLATQINQEFCVAQKETIASYSSRNWGLSACLGPKGYKAYGSPPGRALNDGTIAVHAAGGSLPFYPEETIKTLMHFFDHHKDTLYTPYGFKDSFNLEVSWWAQEHLGIDQGIILLAIENLMRETVWKRFMKLEPIRRWIELCKLEPKHPGPRTALEPQLPFTENKQPPMAFASKLNPENLEFRIGQKDRG